MDTSTTATAVMAECNRRSHEGTIDFGSVVVKLTAAGVESYHADYRRGETTYYTAAGASHVITTAPDETPIADAFVAADVQAAVRGAQRGEVRYPEFVRRTRAAGCVGYVVWLAGRQVQYFGRRGEIHVEHMPATT